MIGVPGFWEGKVIPNPLAGQTRCTLCYWVGGFGLSGGMNLVCRVSSSGFKTYVSDVWNCAAQVSPLVRKTTC